MCNFNNKLHIFFIENSLILLFIIIKTLRLLIYALKGLFENGETTID